MPCPDRLARNVRTYRITRVDGTFQFATTSDPGRLLLTGQPTDLGVMDVTQLRGISKTAPYFHNNSAATLEEVRGPLHSSIRACGSSESAAQLAAVHFFERARRRSRGRDGGRAGRVVGLHAKALICLVRR